MLAVERTDNVGPLDSVNPFLFFLTVHVVPLFSSASVELHVSLDFGRRLDFSFFFFFFMVLPPATLKLES